MNKDALVTKEAFERWDEQIRLRFIGTFRDAYNTENGTTFDIYKDTLIDADDFDFTLRNPDGKILKVQHTFAAADPELEYVGEKLQEEVVSKIRAQLADIKNIYVSFGFRGILKNKKEAEILANDIEKFVRRACNNTSPVASDELKLLRHFRYTDANIPSDLGSVSSLLTSIDVYSKDKGDIIVGSGGPAAPRLTDDHRAGIAIRHKENHYTNPEDLVLIVHYNTPFLGGFYEPIIREQSQDSRFLEVWLYDAWADRFVSIK